eukprot:gnl/TRDRNA2_/TRDRNA2_177288_c2_seq3.p1 gnl/TRDRNA2_/TRDRNA2_177288_c2~~gnl/TRDRNA2_/TRDRNA2_177288_c2_seq3.p1  ORF type:complete len:355 (-),score=73.09 gnl/TRDRNA2_/TRDRNA2_177288_c2_seq3:75-1139(-)
MVARLATAGRTTEAAACLQAGKDAGHWDEVSRRMASALNVGSNSEKRPCTPRAATKADLLLSYVFSHAPAGDPQAVCASIEKFVEEVLRPTRQWFKIAGGAKMEIIAGALARAPAGGDVLEIGTYFGYSAMRLAISEPCRRIVTIEVDIVHALTAQCLIAYAGLSHRIDVWMGHSKDVLERLPAADRSVAAVFMDQSGARFGEDLGTLIALGRLKPGAVIVADNVLKPGAPLFLWHMLFDGNFDTQIFSVPEFAMNEVEDWIAVASYSYSQCSPSEDARPLTILPEPTGLHDLEWEANQMRVRAASPGSVDFKEWASFSEWMRRCLLEFGIEATEMKGMHNVAQDTIKTDEQAQ